MNMKNMLKVSDRQKNVKKKSNNRLSLSTHQTDRN